MTTMQQIRFDRAVEFCEFSQGVPRNTMDCMEDLIALVRELKANENQLQERAERAEARVKELEAIVARLPLTADGVPMWPGMQVWIDMSPTNHGAYPTTVRDYGCDFPAWCRPDLRIAYSTREAAEQAAKKGTL